MEAEGHQFTIQANYAINCLFCYTSNNNNGEENINYKFMLSHMSLKVCLLFGYA